MANEDFSIDDYRTLCKAIAQGALRVEYGDKVVEYRKLDDMLRIKNMMAESLGLNNRSNSRRVGVFSKSWN